MQSPYLCPLLSRDPELRIHFQHTAGREPGYASSRQMLRVPRSAFSRCIRWAVSGAVAPASRTWQSPINVGYSRSGDGRGGTSLRAPMGHTAHLPVQAR